MIKSYLCTLCLMAGMGSAGGFLLAQATAPITESAAKPGEKHPSGDAQIWDFHNLGEIGGTDNLYRSASPLRDLEKKIDQPDATSPALAHERLQHLYDLGIRTIVSLEQPVAAADATKEDKTRWVALERETAKEVGITYISHPMLNSGKNSLETLSPTEILAWLQSVETDLFAAAKKGGVDVHCSAGHDRTGIVTAYLRIKYEHWPVDKAIQEMRDYGHNWVKYSSNNGVSSWQEADLRAIATIMEGGSATQKAGGV